MPTIELEEKDCAIIFKGQEVELILAESEDGDEATDAQITSTAVLMALEDEELSEMIAENMLKNLVQFESD